MSMAPVAFSAYTMTSALGRGLAPTLTALCEMRSGLQPCDLAGVDLDTCIGKVAGLDTYTFDAFGGGRWAKYDCRNNRLAALALVQDGFDQAVAAVRAKYGPHRIGIVLGTSTSGIAETENAYVNRDSQGNLPFDYLARYPCTHNTYSLVAFVSAWLQLQGPALVISTACSSSAKAFVTASRYLATGLCDAVVVGGVDTLCLTTLYGFNSLQLTATGPCRPCAIDRDGLSLGEAGAFVLLERADSRSGNTQTLLRGYGESNDGYHMSHPHPEGVGAVAAMHEALQRAEVAPHAIDFISLHGTATPANDATEDLAISKIFGGDTPCSATKGWTGHTLGAAGAVSAVLAALSIEHGLIPGTANTTRVDPAFGSQINLNPVHRPIRNVLLNIFGFGGNNCCLVLGRA